MSNQDPIYYLRAFLEAPAGLLPLNVRASTICIVGHFYVRTDSQPTAGAAAHDYCRLQGLVFKEYICLPALITREHIEDDKDEQVRAYELASTEGDAVVLSLVLGGTPS